MSGSNGSVETFTNTGFNVTGNNDTIGTDVPVGSTAGSTGTITGTGDSLTEGSGDSFNVQNTGTGTDKVVFSGLGDYVGLLGGSGYTLSGSNGSVNTLSNTSFSVNGLNDKINLTQGDTAVVVGNNDTIAINASTLNVSGLGNMVFLDPGSSNLNDTSSGMKLSVSAASGSLRLSDVANDPSFVINLTGGVGGYTSAASAVSALQSDGSGGTLLHLGNGSSASLIDFVNTSQNILNSSHFIISQ